MHVTHDRAAAVLLRDLPAPRVLAAMGPQLPAGLVAAIIREARRTDRVLTLLVADLTGRFAFLDAAARAQVRAGRLRVVVLAGAVPVDLAADVDHVPASMWDVDGMIASGVLPFDVVVARMRPTGRPGWLGYGDIVGYTHSALTTSARAGFELQPAHANLPGTDPVPLDRAQVVVTAPVGEADADAPPGRSPSDAQLRVAARVADLVPCQATVQVGLGAVPEAVVAALVGRHDLRVHSGVLPGALRRLSTVGPMVATGVLGDASCGWGEVCLEPLSRTHDPVRLLGLWRLWAVNSGFEVDLTGAVNAEYRKGLRIASGGGQTDFVRAAHLGAEGASVLALPSRSAGAPRIVAHLGVPATTPGGEVDLVVTEYGVADLRGRSATDRAAALVAVAHPDDRPSLAAGL
ncbi:putative Acetyl-CoA hydrolase [Frankia canadensis]|uniref:Putative Acetyl-CoA hydrolase n=1 Tax=Frankia canadensis TaxID=1836972 RepID=A0A2I2KI97_9ACTN|nr:acetyl-CoA hydrolase/transferase C-terminal domain-containing protein [Frankia canadensis]SNQ45397.1 putative Acetyl-CoA hydrolase [Frankia canadensis]SOU52687.1 putative Acetyl-CoA hydrolase [Frankia canadensis]